MRYVPLATSLRPKTWEAFISNEPVVAILRSMITENRLPNGLILSGTRGVGKTSAARLFAKALNCQKPDNGNPCGVCPNCLAADLGDYPDLIEVDGASRGNLEDIKELLSIASMSPFMGKFKVFIVDEAQNLSRSSASWDLLLKELEEPSEHVFWIFCSTQKHRIPIMIQSRLVVLDFHMVPTSIIADYLSKILYSSEVSEEVVLAIAKSARNSIRDGLTILDKIFPYCEENGWTEGNVLKVLGTLSLDFGLSLLNSIVNFDVVSAWSLINNSIEEGIDTDQIFTALEDTIESLLLCILGTPFPGQDRIMPFVEQLTVPRIQYLSDCVLRRAEGYKSASNKKFVLELLIMELCA